MNTKLQIAFFVLSSLAIFIGIVWSVKTERRLKRFFTGKKAKDLEDTILDLAEEIKKLKEAKTNIEHELSVVNSKVKKSIRGLETVRFNAFTDQGSNQSFAIGVLDEEGDGVVLSSLYSRERMSVFAKPIKGMKSEFELTGEEKEALKKAEVK